MFHLHRFRDKRDVQCGSGLHRSELLQLPRVSVADGSRVGIRLPRRDIDGVLQRGHHEYTVFSAGCECGCDSLVLWAQTRRILWVESNRMLGGYTIWQGMSGNGAMTGTMTIPPKQLRILLEQLQARTA